MSNLRSELGQRVRAARAAARLTQRAVAAELGVEHSSVQRWESGKISLDRIEPLAQCLGCSPEWLLFGLGEPPDQHSTQQ